MSRLRGWWRITLGVMALLAVPALVEAHSLTGSGGWWDELICLVPALIMVAVVLLLGRDGDTKRKGQARRVKPDDPGSGKAGDTA